MESQPNSASTHIVILQTKYRQNKQNSDRPSQSIKMLLPLIVQNVTHFLAVALKRNASDRDFELKFIIVKILCIIFNLIGATESMLLTQCTLMFVVYEHAHISQLVRLVH